MTFPDVNLLIYAYNRDDARFPLASSWFKDLMNGPEKTAFCWETINGFIRISTNRNALPHPFTLDEAFLIVRDWLESPSAVFLKPAENHLEVLQSVSLAAQAVGRLYSDAVLAAYAISHNAVFATCDRHFRIFDGLKLTDPLA